MQGENNTHFSTERRISTRCRKKKLQCQIKYEKQHKYLSHRIPLGMHRSVEKALPPPTSHAVRYATISRTGCIPTACKEKEHTFFYRAMHLYEMREQKNCNAKSNMKNSINISRTAFR
jgi:hypothetical protein